MNARLVYLAGPIYEQDDACHRWRSIAGKLLRKRQIMMLAPTDADYGGKNKTVLRDAEQIVRDAERIVRTAKSDIMTCDTILAKYDVPSAGTAMAIMFAWSLQKQIVVVTSSRSPWLEVHASVIFPNLDEAIKSLNFPKLDPHGGA